MEEGEKAVLIPCLSPTTRMYSVAHTRDLFPLTLEQTFPVSVRGREGMPMQGRGHRPPNPEDPTR